jgi:hypothetical protein
MDPLTSAESSHTWLGMFAIRLLELRPSASVVSSIRCAVLRFHVAGDLDPRKAADSYAAAYLRVKATRAALEEDPASSRYKAIFRLAQSATETAPSDTKATPV